MKTEKIICQMLEKVKREEDVTEALRSSRFLACSYYTLKSVACPASAEAVSTPRATALPASA